MVIEILIWLLIGSVCIYGVLAFLADDAVTYHVALKCLCLLVIAAAVAGCAPAPTLPQARAQVDCAGQADVVVVRTSSRIRQRTPHPHDTTHKGCWK